MNVPKPPASVPSSSEMREALHRLRPYFVRSAWFTAIATLLVLVSSWYMLEVYDRVVNSRNLFTLLMLTLVALAAYALMEVLEWAHTEEMREAGNELDTAMRDRIFAASFEANIRRIPGGGTTQPLTDLRTVREFLPSPLVRSLMEAPVALVFLALLWFIHPVLGIASMVGSIAQTFITWLNERATQPPLAAANRSAIAAQSYADGTLRNAQVIEAMGMLRDIHKRWFAKQKEFLDHQVLASDRAGVYTALSKLLQNVLGSGLLGLGTYLALSGDMSGGGGMVIIGSIIGGRVLQPLVAIVTQWRSFVQARVAIARLDSLLGALPAKAKGMPLPAPRGRLVVENALVLAPGTQLPLLRNVSFSANPGEAIGVIGASASGKTTLARALAGIWPSVGGKARLDGVDVHAWDKTELGPYVGYLPQGIELFDGSVAENIARFGEVDMRHVEAAARAAGIHDFILTLPEGYDTDVGPEGARLSGGQRQRIGLARAFYRDPVFIVLDEPNSNLDEAGEAALVAAIRAAKERGTTFVVATHRMGLLSAVDKVLMLRDGAQQVFGPRDEVMAALQRAQQEVAARAQAATQKTQPAAGAAPELAT